MLRPLGTEQTSLQASQQSSEKIHAHLQRLDQTHGSKAQALFSRAYGARRARVGRLKGQGPGSSPVEVLDGWMVFVGEGL